VLTIAIVAVVKVTVVSNQAVYMVSLRTRPDPVSDSDRLIHWQGHFWENPSWSRSQDTFTQRVLNFFTVGATATGVGPQLNPALFPVDQTRVYIMAPRRAPGKGQAAADVKPTSITFIKKLPQLKQAIQTLLGNAVPIVLYNYVALNTDDPADLAIQGTNQRGYALFQFDPNGRGASQPGWRLFYEQHQFQDTDPQPSPDAANGIPDI
jgi:hypothetical protein